MKNPKKYFLIAIMALFSTTLFASSDCYEDPGVANKPQYNGSPMTNEGQDSLSRKKMKEGGNPAMELMMCAMQIAFEGPQAIVEGICGCKEAIENSCEYGFDYGVPFAKASGGAEWAWCAAFAPVYLGLSLL